MHVTVYGGSVCSNVLDIENLESWFQTSMYESIGYEEKYYDVL